MFEKNKVISINIFSKPSFDTFRISNIFKKFASLYTHFFSKTVLNLFILEIVAQ